MKNKNKKCFKKTKNDIVTIIFRTTQKILPSIKVNRCIKIVYWFFYDL